MPQPEGPTIDTNCPGGRASEMLRQGACTPPVGTSETSLASTKAWPGINLILHDRRHLAAGGAAVYVTTRRKATTVPAALPGRICGQKLIPRWPPFCCSVAQQEVLFRGILPAPPRFAISSQGIHHHVTVCRSGLGPDRVLGCGCGQPEAPRSDGGSAFSTCGVDSFDHAIRLPARPSSSQPKNAAAYLYRGRAYHYRKGMGDRSPRDRGSRAMPFDSGARYPRMPITVGRWSIAIWARSIWRMTDDTSARTRSRGARSFLTSCPTRRIRAHRSN